jgi:hypothetical protein
MYQYGLVILGFQWVWYPKIVYMGYIIYLYFYK